MTEKNTKNADVSEDKTKKIKGENVKIAALTMMVMIFLSRALGFVREMMVANVFGRGHETDAFFLAFAIPDTMYYILIGGALSAGFMPIFNAERAKGNEKGAWKATDVFLTFSICFIVLFNIIGVIFAPQLMKIIAVGVAPGTAQFDLIVQLTRIMFTSVTLLVFAGLFTGVLNSYNIFTVPATGPLLYNIGIIIGIFVLSKKFGIFGLASGVVFGAVLNFSIILFRYIKLGKGFRFSFDFKDPLFVRMLILIGPAILGLSFSQLNIFINNNVASLLPDAGNVTALRYANRVMLLPLGIFAASISMALFPTLSNLVGSEEWDKFKAVFLKGFNSVVFVTIPSAVGLLVLCQPIVRLLFRTGRFEESDVLITAVALAFYSFGMVGQSASIILTRGFNSMQDSRTPVIYGGLMLIANLTLNLICVYYTNLGVGGVALSYTLTSIMNAILLFLSLRRKVHGLSVVYFLKSFAKTVSASVLMGAAVYFTFGFLDKILGHEAKLAQLITTASAISVGGIVFVLVAWLLKSEELNVVLNIFIGKLKKKVIKNDKNI